MMLDDFIIDKKITLLLSLLCDYFVIVLKELKMIVLSYLQVFKENIPIIAQMVLKVDCACKVHGCNNYIYTLIISKVLQFTFFVRQKIFQGPLGHCRVSVCQNQYINNKNINKIGKMIESNILNYLQQDLDQLMKYLRKQQTLFSRVCRSIIRMMQPSQGQSYIFVTEHIQKCKQLCEEAYKQNEEFQQLSSIIYEKYQEQDNQNVNITNLLGRAGPRFIDIIFSNTDILIGKLDAIYMSLFKVKEQYRITLADTSKNRLYKYLNIFSRNSFEKISLIIEVLKFIINHLENEDFSTISFAQLNNFLKAFQQKKKSSNMQVKGLILRNFTNSRSSKSRGINKRIISSQQKSNRPTNNPKKTRIYDNIGELMNLNKQQFQQNLEVSTKKQKQDLYQQLLKRNKFNKIYIDNFFGKKQKFWQKTQSSSYLYSELLRMKIKRQNIALDIQNPTFQKEEVRFSKECRILSEKDSNFRIKLITPKHQSSVKQLLKQSDKQNGMPKAEDNRQLLSEVQRVILNNEHISSRTNRLKQIRQNKVKSVCSNFQSQISLQQQILGQLSKDITDQPTKVIQKLKGSIPKPYACKMIPLQFTVKTRKASELPKRIYF